MIKKLGLDEDKENSPNLCNISPLKLNDIKPCKLKTKNGLIEVNESSNFQMEIINSNIVFSIFENGTQVMNYCIILGWSEEGEPKNKDLRTK